MLPLVWCIPQIPAFSTIDRRTRYFRATLSRSFFSLWTVAPHVSISFDPRLLHVTSVSQESLILRLVYQAYFPSISSFSYFFWFLKSRKGSTVSLCVCVASTKQTKNRFSVPAGSPGVRVSSATVTPYPRRKKCPMKVLMVAEKPSIADAIANAMAGQDSERKSHKRAGVPVHTYRGTFRGRRAQFVCTSVRGHLFGTDFPSTYQDRSATDPRTLFSAPTLKIPTSQGLVRCLEQLGNGADHLVLWLDCDAEGENICFEVLRVVAPKMTRRKEVMENVWRAKFSAVTPKDIERAMSTLGRPNKNESLAVDARQELDLKIGVAWTRFQTRLFQSKYGRRFGTVSYGPCQTPTLGFCVARHDMIQQFRSESFWFIEGVADVADDDAKRSIRVRWSRRRLFDQSVATALIRTVLERPIGRVIRVRRQECSTSPPLPLNTVSMLKIASRALGIGPKETMRIAEDLYLRGLISYPRTETSRYPKHFDVSGAIRARQRHPEYGEYAKGLLERPVPRNHRRGVDAGDHPPITPVSAACDVRSMRAHERRLYDMIVRHFLASVSPPCLYERSSATLRCCMEDFEMSGVRILDPGFTEILPKSAPPASDPLPESMTEEMECALRVRLSTGTTQPPGHVAEHELVSMMERHGIGTDASMATHIANIVKRKYVSLGPGRTLVPTEMGLTLIHGFLQIDPELVLPRVRRSIEEECKLVARGEARYDDVLDHALDLFTKKYDYFVKNVGKLDALFSMHYSPHHNDNVDDGSGSSRAPEMDVQRMSRCGVCQTYMRYVSLPPHRLFCATCDATYGLPGWGSVSQCSGQYCPLDHFELIYHTPGTGKPKTKLCPRCFNDPPFEDTVTAEIVDKKKDRFHHMTCNSCPHPGCSHSFLRQVVCRCPSSVVHSTSSNERRCGGHLILAHVANVRGHAVRGKKNKGNSSRWQLRCNGCALVITIHRAKRVRVIPKRYCDVCDASLLHVDFDAKKAKRKPELYAALTSHATSSKEERSSWWQYEACVVCDDTLNAQTSAHHE